jgi:hypothetical protein
MVTGRGCAARVCSAGPGKPPTALSAWGTAYFDATRMGTFRGEVTDYEPPARIGFRETLRWFGSDLMEARPNYTLEADRGQDDRSSRRGG